MLDTGILLSYAAVVLGLLLIPGPAVVLILTRATVNGRRVGLATGLGIAFGDLVHAVTATFGLSAILTTSAVAFCTVKYVGAAYLIYLGFHTIVEHGRVVRPVAARAVDVSRAFRQAVLTEVLNPKTALFFLAFLPQFVRPDRGSIVAQLATLGLIFVAMSVTSATLFALAGSHVGQWFVRRRGDGRWQGRIVGTLYLGLGLRLALQAR